MTMDAYGYHFMGTHFVWWAIWLALVVAVFFMAASFRRKTVRHYREDPLGILRRRYAAGEITTEDYEERKARIEA
jgi:putative membrane protein